MNIGVFLKIPLLLFVKRQGNFLEFTGIKTKGTKLMVKKNLLITATIFMSACRLCIQRAVAL